MMDGDFDDFFACDLFYVLYDVRVWVVAMLGPSLWYCLAYGVFGLRLHQNPRWGRNSGYGCPGANLMVT